MLREVITKSEIFTTDHEVHGSRRHDGVQAGDGGQLIIAYL